jgi:hypothetical protein
MLGVGSMNQGSRDQVCIASAGSMEAHAPSVSRPSPKRTRSEQHIFRPRDPGPPAHVPRPRWLDHTRVARSSVFEGR